MARTAAQVFVEIEDILSPVPDDSYRYACPLCLGPVPVSTSPFRQCYDCYKLFYRSECPKSLRNKVVPMSIALNRGPWYSVLWTYKRAAFVENAPKVAALTHFWLRAQEENIETLLGGPWSMLTIVPSTRIASYADQRLRMALSKVKALDSQLVQTLMYTGGDHGHMRYTPEIFSSAGSARIRGRRIVLIEDSWVTGATALSAAGALLREGAESVVITPIAREVRLAFWEKEGPHPYFDQVRNSAYELTAWPR